ncbi:hypothetical protein [Actinomycetospora termitidis]|uniref:Uncharacterized protein n=1 Tax=Actinomycetospora termitidis TaxID=3053470 RepID=A0ABT7M567_9PSEU|nr:hypothetical protein [Actinomycetospora sp. Odt1-22]MDL5154922.1 hypothetical protein [Actinomycetospora sp. Odt1-22]
MPVPARGPRSTVARVPHPAVPAARRSPEEAAAAVSPRDRAVLMAVAAGRCTMGPEQGEGLMVDGRPCSDQFAGHRLVRAGLVRLVAQPPGRPSTVVLSPAGVALLGLPITV